MSNENPRSTSRLANREHCILIIRKRLSILETVKGIRRFILFPILSILLCSCYSYKISNPDSRKLRADDASIPEKKNVYVINPEMADEYSILMASNIFHVVPDSSVTGVIKIKLLPHNRKFMCANFLIGWGMFLGQLPIKMPSGRNFRFAEINNDKEMIHEFELPFFVRYWFWDIFSRRKNYNKVAGQALRQSFHSPD